MKQMCKLNLNIDIFKNNIMCHKILRSTFFIFYFLFSIVAFSQTKQDAISEADRLKISSKQEAIDALNSKGLSESQIREMAKLRGIDYDTALAEYLSSKSGDPINTNTSDLVVSDVVSEIKIDTLSQAIDTLPKVKLAKKIENYFGYDIFINNPFGQKEYLLGNIDEGYILTPGDELRITVFGDNNLELVSKIDLNGNIIFPKLGVFFAAGSSFATLKNRIKIFLGKFYSGLLSEPSRTFLDVSLTQIRPVKISVLGNVNTPGPHLVSGMATVLNALYASGGVNTSGTLREVKVYRNNKLIKTIDLYNYITQGNIDKDIRLANNDVLFVGPRRSSVTLSGKVKKSAIYELKSNESLQDLLQYSGGILAGASLKNVNISRIKPFKDRKQELVFDRFLTTLNFSDYKENKKQHFPIVDGDVVFVKAVLDKQINEVTISGNVNAPGTFALDVYSDLKTLILKGAQGLKPNTYLGKIDINKIDKNGILSFKTFNLQSVLNNEFQVLLDENDQVKIYSLLEVEGEKTVSISGYGVGNKTVSIRENLSLFDLIFQSVSFEELDFQAKVLASRLDLKRYDANSGLYDIKQYSLSDLEILKSTNLQPKDEVVLYTKSVTEELSPKVEILGQVNDPGEFSLSNKMYLEDLIISAGGFTKFALRTSVSVNRLDRDLENGRYSKLINITPDLDYMLGLKKIPSDPFVLENDDIVTVVSPIRAKFLPKISVQGEVNFPRTIILENDRTKISELIDFSGGLTSNHNLESSYVERDSLKLYLNIKNNTLDSKTFLQDGDLLVIGSKLNPVKTKGAVLNPTVFNWNQGKRAKYYIRASGGKKKRIESIIVQRANGSSKSVSLFSNPKIYPGSVINVIEKPEKIKGDGGTKFFDNITRTVGLITGTLTTILLLEKL
jgi:polysaccharide export outer membrane protein